MKSSTKMLSLIPILIVSLFAGAGTLAYFSDTGTSTGNTFIAGLFGIEIDGNSLPFKAKNNAWMERH